MKELEIVYYEKYGLGIFDDGYNNKDSEIDSDNSIGVKKSYSRRNYSKLIYSLRLTRRIVT